MALLFQLVDVTWLAPAIVQNTVGVQMHSMFTVTPRVVPVPHRVSALGYLLGATSKFTLLFQLNSSLMPLFYLSDSVAARVLANNVNVNGQVSIETCTAACQNAGYSLAGAEYAGQCCE
jgi:hypothetical protein